MLRRIAAGCVVTLLVATGGSMALPPVTAANDAGMECAEVDPETGECLWWLDLTFTGDPAIASANVGGVGGGIKIWCSRGSNYNSAPNRAELEEVRCQHPEYGWYSQAYDCRFEVATRISPDAEDVIGYEDGAEGSVYEAMCFTANHPLIPSSNYCFSCTPPGWPPPPVPHLVFLEAPPDGYGGEPDPVPDLVVQAITRLTMQAPTIGTAPPAGQGSALVRLPVWLWNDVSETNSGTLTAQSDPIAGVYVQAEATAAGIVWDMGDGGTVPCDDGVAFQPGMDVFDPPCGHTYNVASRNQPSGTYPISATTAWQVEWSTVGLPEERGGEFALELTATTELQVSELQVLSRNPR